MARSVLILGASGKIGHHSALAFKNAGWQVKTFDRKKDNMTEAAKGVQVIVNGLNPPDYHDWENQTPKITNAVIEAARANGATVIIPGNVYHFGDVGGIWSENTPPNPVSRKGKIRLEMEQSYKESGVQVIVLRAGNFIDPEHNGDVMSLIYLRNIAKDKITLPGRRDVKQAFCYVPDWARAAVALAEKRDTLAQFEDIPFPGLTMTADELKSDLEKALGRDLRFQPFPWWLMRLGAPFWELARELNEMRYLWNTDHALSRDRFFALLPDFQLTDQMSVLRAALPDELVKKPTA